MGERFPGEAMGLPDFGEVSVSSELRALGAPSQLPVPSPMKARRRRLSFMRRKDDKRRGSVIAGRAGDRTPSQPSTRRPSLVDGALPPQTPLQRKPSFYRKVKAMRSACKERLTRKPAQPVRRRNTISSPAQAEAVRTVVASVRRSQRRSRSVVDSPANSRYALPPAPDMSLLQPQFDDDEESVAGETVAYTNVTTANNTVNNTFSQNETGDLALGLGVAVDEDALGDDLFGHLQQQQQLSEEPEQDKENLKDSGRRSLRRLSARFARRLSSTFRGKKKDKGDKDNAAASAGAFDPQFDLLPSPSSTQPDSNKESLDAVLESAFNSTALSGGDGGSNADDAFGDFGGDFGDAAAQQGLEFSDADFGFSVPEVPDFDPPEVETGATEKTPSLRRRLSMKLRRRSSVDRSKLMSAIRGTGDALRRSARRASNAFQHKAALRRLYPVSQNDSVVAELDAMASSRSLEAFDIMAARLVQERKKQRPPPPLPDSLQDLIGNPEHAATLAMFIEFMDKVQYCGELWRFYTAVISYEQLDDDEEQRQQEARRMFDLYISTSGEDQVNIDAAMLQRIEERVEAAPLNLFDEAKAEVFKLILENPYQGFFKSKHYRIFVLRYQYVL
ncbi:MAG: hypothetical protein MHM6MM_002845 [Cercozoa sp. M6MM]